MNTSIIGGADGPTQVYLSSSSGWINTFGLMIVVLILIPNIIYAFKFRGVSNKCTNKGMNRMEQIGRYASMACMIFHFGLLEFGFNSVGAFLIYLFANVALIILYWIVWFVYFKKQNMWKSIILAIVPTLIFLICGVTLRNIPLIVVAIIFGIGHIYVTYQNAK